MTLSEMTTQFQSLMNRSDLKNNPSLASTFINNAILRLQRELRVPFMEKTIVYTIPAGWNGKLSIPSDLLELISLSVDSDKDGVIDMPLQRGQMKEVLAASEAFNAGSAPRVFTRKGGTWILGPSPAAGDQVEIYYFAEFAPLVAPTDTNTLSKIAWDAVVYGALSAACDYYNDERAKSFENRYGQITQMLQAQGDADELTADAAVRPAMRFEDDMYNGY
jgi:hypothetical protein